LDTAIEIDVKLGANDLSPVSRVLLKNSKSRLINRVLLTTSILISGITVFASHPNVDIKPTLIILGCGIVAYYILIYAFRDIIYRKTYSDNSVFYQRRHYSFSATGINVTSPHAVSTLGWPAISSIQKTQSHLFLLFPGNNQAHVIPFRAIPAAWSPDNLLKQLEAWRTQASTDTAKAA
jgi:hypothetical protein